MPLADDWMVYTFEQTNGRGQAGSKWESAPQKNLTFSIVYRMEYLAPSDQFYVNMAISLGIAAYLESLGLSCKIKWPNDIYVNDRKIAGILIENHLRGNSFRYAVVGIGLNVNQTQFHHPKATSIALEKNMELDLVASIAELRDYLGEKLNLLKQGFKSEIAQAYRISLFRLNQPAMYKAKEHTFVGVIKGIDAIGRLRIATEHGEHLFSLKEVVFI